MPEVKFIVWCVTPGHMIRYAFGPNGDYIGDHDSLTTGIELGQLTVTNAKDVNLDLSVEIMNGIAINRKYVCFRVD